MHFAQRVPDCASDARSIIGLHIACMQPMARRAWLYMCAAVSAHLSGGRAPARGGRPRSTATESYYRPSRIRSAPTYPIPDVCGDEIQSHQLSTQLHNFGFVTVFARRRRSSRTDNTVNGNATITLDQSILRYIRQQSIASATGERVGPGAVNNKNIHDKNFRLTDIRHESRPSHRPPRYRPKG